MQDVPNNDLGEGLANTLLVNQDRWFSHKNNYGNHYCKA
jgi:hypothetical protein